MTTKRDVLKHFEADNEAQAARHLFKYTNCGAWILFKPWGIVLGSIVEGCDFGTASYSLRYADDFTAQDILDRINAIEREAEALWDWANISRDITGRKNWRGKTDAERGLDPPDISREYLQFTQGERSC